MTQQIGFRAVVRRRANGKCEGCGHRISKRINSGKQGTIHHRSPRRNGLDNSVTNLLLLCLKCHQEVHRNEDLAALKGMLIHSDAAATPVLLHRWRWALLTPSGAYRDMPEAEALALIDSVERLRGNQLAGLA